MNRTGALIAMAEVVIVFILCSAAVAAVYEMTRKMR
jgi:hypothetical protein